VLDSGGHRFIGRHSLDSKIRRPSGLGGSTPPPGTNKINGLTNQGIFGCLFLCPNYAQIPKRTVPYCEPRLNALTEHQIQKCVLARFSNQSVHIAMCGANAAQFAANPEVDCFVREKKICPRRDLAIRAFRAVLSSSHRYAQLIPGLS